MKKHIECFYSVDASEVENIGSIHRRLPDGTLDLVFNLASPVMVSRNGGGNYIEMPTIVLTGLYPDRTFLKYTGEINLVGIVFKPGSAHLFVNDNLENYKECVIDASLIFGNKIYILLEQLKHNSNESQRHNLMESFIVNFLKKRNLESHILKIHDAVQQIHKMEGNVEISTLYKNHFISERTFRRKFVEFVGMAPKQYASIIRVKSFSKIYESSRIPFVDIIYGLGYTDQSHFSKEFQRVVGVNPSRFFKELNGMGKEFIHLI